MRNDREMRLRKERICRPGRFRAREERPVGGRRDSRGKAMCVDVFKPSVEVFKPTFEVFKPLKCSNQQL